MQKSSNALWRLPEQNHVSKLHIMRANEYMSLYIECVYMHNKILIIIKNLLIKKTVLGVCANHETANTHFK